MNKNWRASTQAYVNRLDNRVIPEFLPNKVLESIENQVESTDQYPKTLFSKFVSFMVTSGLWSSDKKSTRRLAELSAVKLLQRLSEMDEVSHQTISDCLRTVSITGILDLITLLVERARHFQTRRMKGLDLLKIFDCTTIEKSPKLYDWAAPNGDNNAVRIALGVDHQSDMSYCLVDASDTTSDNTVFPELVERLKSGETGVYDAGFTKIDCFHKINPSFSSTVG